MRNYQDLTLKALKDLLRDRNIAGRSKATTKEKAIALLEECDRLSADENLPAPVENFTGSPPSPPAPPTFPEPEPEPADESEYTEGVQCPKCAQCGSFETWPERDGGYWCENCNYQFTPPDPKAECFQATLEKAEKLKGLMRQTLAQAENSTETKCFNANDQKNDDRRERIETSGIQSPSGAVVNKVASTASIAESIPQSFNDVKTTDNDENNSDSAEKLAEQIWRSSLEFIDYHGQPAKRVSLSQAEILVNLSPESVYRLIIFEYGQGIVMSSPARSAPAASKFFLSFVSGGGRRFWLGNEENPTSSSSRAEAYSERHAKAKAAYHRQFPQEFPNIQIFERSQQNQWYEHRLVRTGKNWRQPSIYEVIPVNPIDLSPRSPPCTA